MLNSSEFFIVHPSTYRLRNFIPISILNNHEKSNIKDDGGYSKSKPKSRDSKIEFKSEGHSQRHPTAIIADE